MRDIKSSKVKRDNKGPQRDGRDNMVKVEVISSFFALVGTLSGAVWPLHVSAWWGGTEGQWESSS